MNNSDLEKIIRDIGVYQAEYQPVPLSSKPSVGCDLPSLLPGVVVLPPVDFPDIPKICVPPFIPFPIILDPFPIPETCPSGISFNPHTVHVYTKSPIAITDPIAGAFIISATVDPNNVCNFDINIPDVVIPCFPDGPRISGSAAIHVNNANNTLDPAQTTEITMTSSGLCNWQLGGDITIDIPLIPCPPDGPLFQFFVSGDDEPLEIVHPPIVPGGTELNLCISQIELPLTTCTDPTVTIDAGFDGSSGHVGYDLCDFPLTIPCYPTGPRVTIMGVDGKDWKDVVVPITAAFGDFQVWMGNRGLYVSAPDVVFSAPQSGHDKTVGYATIDIHDQISGVTITHQGSGYTTPPTVSFSPSYGNPTAMVVRSGGTGGILESATCEFNIPVPIPICTTGFNWINNVGISIGQTTIIAKGTIARLFAGQPGHTISYPAGVAVGTDIVVTISPSTFTGSWTSQVTVGGSTSKSGPVTAGTFTVPAVNKPGVVRIIVTSTDSKMDLFTVPVGITYAGNNADVKSKDTIEVITIQEYQRRNGFTLTEDCGAALVGSLDIPFPSLPCPVSVTSNKKTLTFGASGPREITASTTLSVTDCALGFETLTIPALVCPNGWDDSTVDIALYAGPTSTGPIAPGTLTDPPVTGGVIRYIGFTGGIAAIIDGDNQACGFKLTGAITLPPSTGGGSGTDYLASHFIGEYDHTAAYSYGDIVTVSPGNTADDTCSVPGVYIAYASFIKPSSSTSPGSTFVGNRPHHPLSTCDGTYWKLLSTYPSKTVVCSPSGVQSTAVADQQPTSSNF